MNMLNFQSKELNLLKYLPTLSKIGVIYLAQYIIHVSAERSKVTNTFGLLSCSWRDDQIRMLQGDCVWLLIVKTILSQFIAALIRRLLMLKS